ncbi:hypothetical protein [Lysobacter panacisoli]|uniref:YCII-related domain-containing protein n=1 Tax=Lysobacter panacisoli TaxID=1255263 RepID=A0ABP9LQ43_9GAMM|nr:hypothetical protein [Lysobacter panacisoli]
MKRYLAVFLGTAASMEQWKALSEDERARREKAGMEAWGQWVKRYEAAIVDGGSPLGKTKRIASKGIADVRNELAAWTVVEAESHEAAARMFEGHPHFTIFPGDAVEVMECLPMPTG